MYLSLIHISGGAISYVEVPNMQDNIDAVLTVMKHIYEHIMYAELNTKSDYCMECGYDGEIQIKEDADGKLIWVCPNCGCLLYTSFCFCNNARYFS